MLEMSLMAYHGEFDIKWITGETAKHSRPPLNPLLEQGGDRGVVD
jgi:hypothetical protein